MDVLTWFGGIASILMGFIVVIAVGYDKERLSAAAALVLGIIGGFLLCLSVCVGG